MISKSEMRFDTIKVKLKIELLVKRSELIKFFISFCK